MFEKIQKFLVPIIFVSLLLIPQIAGGKYYFVGGDDLKLYYVFPEKYLENYVFNIITDNTLAGAKTGYYPVSEIAPFLYFILFLKKVLPYVNTQYLLYGLNYSFAFLFFYLFLNLWSRGKNKFAIFINISASLFYVLSPFLFSTIYNHKLLPFYLVFLFPAVMYLLTRAIFEGKKKFVVYAALTYVVFGMTLNNMPWVVYFGICSLPLIVFLFTKYPKRFLVSATLFIFLYVLLNLHSIYHLINSQVFVKGLAATLDFYSSEEFRAENIRGIIGTATAFSPLSQPLLVFDNPNFQQINLGTFKNLIFLVVIVLAGSFIYKAKESKYTQIYITSLICLLIAWFSFSPNIAKWGPDLFLNVVSRLPFMTMFRNMFDKFAIPLSFYYAFLLGLSFHVLAKELKNKLFARTLLVISILAIFVNGVPILKQERVHEGNQATISGQLNDDFISLVDFVQKTDNESTIMWIPLTAPNYISVEDKYLRGHYYSGLSPLRILAGKSDYAGRFGLILQIDLFRGDKLLSLLREQKYDDFGYEIQKLNVRYLVLDHQKYPSSMMSFLYDADGKYLKYQNQEFKDVLLGAKIKDFGERYTLYELNQKFLNDKLYLTDDLRLFPDNFENIKYQKKSSSSYKIDIKNLKETKHLVFLDPYYKDWTLSLVGSNETANYKTRANQIVFDYANGWEIDPADIQNRYASNFFSRNEGGSINLILNLNFEPDNISPILLKISTVFFVCILAAIGWSLLKTGWAKMYEK